MIIVAYLKLVQIIKQDPKSIASQWVRDIRVNPRTPSYHSIPEIALLPVCINLCSDLEEIMFSDDIASFSQQYFGQYAEEHHAKSIPLNEALYALILIKRHIWLNGTFQNLFMSVDSVQRVVILIQTNLVFDYATFFMTKRYQELNSSIN